MFDYVKVQEMINMYEKDLLRMYDHKKLQNIVFACKRELLEAISTMPVKDPSLTLIDFNGMPRHKSVNTAADQRNTILSAVHGCNLDYALTYLEGVTRDNHFDAKVQLYVKQLLIQCNYHSNTF